MSACFSIRRMGWTTRGEVHMYRWGQRFDKIAGCHLLERPFAKPKAFKLSPPPAHTNLVGARHAHLTTRSLPSLLFSSLSLSLLFHHLHDSTALFFFFFFLQHYRFVVAGWRELPANLVAGEFGGICERIPVRIASPEIGAVLVVWILLNVVSQHSDLSKNSGGGLKKESGDRADPALIENGSVLDCEIDVQGGEGEKRSDGDKGVGWRWREAEELAAANYVTFEVENEAVDDKSDDVGVAVDVRCAIDGVR